MKAKFLILVALIFTCFLDLKANMASPIEPGSSTGSPVASDKIDVIREDLQILLDSAFETAAFTATYIIRSEWDSITVPLLFYAMGIESEMQVFLDGKPVSLIPYDYSTTYFGEDSTANFYAIFSRMNADEYLLFASSGKDDLEIRYEDCRYFDVLLERGEHEIRVEYSAIKWLDGWERINKIFFQYALEPARFWKSFGSLNISLDASRYSQPITTNLGTPHSGDLKTVAKWQFEEIPVAVLKVNKVLVLGFMEKAFLSLGPFGTAMIFGLFLLIFEIILIIKWRKRNPNSDKIHWPVILGFSCPVLLIITWIACEFLRGDLLGEFAGPIAGYSDVAIFLGMIILFVIALPINILLTFTLDQSQKKLRSVSIYPPPGKK